VAGRKDMFVDHVPASFLHGRSVMETGKTCGLLGGHGGWTVHLLEPGHWPSYPPKKSLSCRSSICKPPRQGKISFSPSSLFQTKAENGRCVDRTHPNARTQHVSLSVVSCRKGVVLRCQCVLYLLNNPK